MAGSRSQKILAPTPARWVFKRSHLALAFVALVVGVIFLFSGEAWPLVLETALLGALLIPLLLSATMLGLACTEPLEKATAFADCGLPKVARLVLSTALGLGIFSLGMVILGQTGWVAVGGMGGSGGDSLPLLLLLLGALAGLRATWRFIKSIPWSWWRAGVSDGHSFWLLAASIPLAVLLVSCCYHPQVLWANEKGWYDVLEYHLQMPREYLAHHSTAPVSHNVYSYMPANVEMLYTLLLSMIYSVKPLIHAAAVTDLPTWGAQMVNGGASGGEYGGGHTVLVYVAQMLHAMLVLLTASAVALAPWRLSTAGRIAAFLLILGTPWTIIIGSQAYNDGGMVLFGTLALVWLPMNWKTSDQPWFGRMLLVGALLGLAVGCKLTAGIMFAVPVALLLLLRGQWRQLLLATATALVLFLPWAIRDYAATGNPVFPIAAQSLGKGGGGPWNTEQIKNWNQAHGATAEESSLSGRTQALVNASLMHDYWSISTVNFRYWLDAKADYRKAKTQVVTEWDGLRFLGWMWLALPAALLILFLLRQKNQPHNLLGWQLGGFLLVQIVGWMFFTHLQSRFLWPILPTLAALVAVLVSRVSSGDQSQSVPPRLGLRLAVLAVLALTTIHALGTYGLVNRELTPQGRNQKIFAGSYLFYSYAYLYPECLFMDSQDQLQNLPKDWAKLASTADSQTQAGPTGEGRGGGGEARILLLGSATPFYYDQPVIYCTAWDRPAWLEILRSQDAEKIIKWLRQQNIRMVILDPYEIKRLNKSYGTPIPLSSDTERILVLRGYLKPVTPVIKTPYQIYLVR